MIVVLAHAGDHPARALVEAWRVSGAVLVTPADLVVDGWVVPFQGPGGTFVAEGRRRETGAVTAAMVRLGAVDPVELPTLVEADRSYAASEITALLAYWLRALRGPVVNRPSPDCLAGPGWSIEEWLTRAARAGVPTGTWARHPGETPPPPPEVDWVTVVGGEVFGTLPAPAVAGALATLAAAGGVGVLGAGFVAGGDAAGTAGEGRAHLARVTLCPALDGEDERRALAALLARPR